VSFFKPKFVLLLAASVTTSLALLGACTGGEFAGADSASNQGGAQGSGGSSNRAGSGTGESGSVGTGASTGVSCSGSEDCDDKDSCTRDRCTADGTCDASPMCPGTEKCCGGDCAECCGDEDCDDGIGCTANTCFAGKCMYVPDDAKCEATEYCAIKDDCRPKQVCGLAVEEDVAVACDDMAGCTVDSCVDNFCKHDFCPDPEAKLCCEAGCASQCCNDSQCNTDADPCTVGSCKDGKCSLVPLCGEGEECCPSADGKTATCGACCKAADCDDSVGCTEDKCGGGQCSNTPDSSRCPAGYLCDVNEGSCQKAPDCKSAADCHPTACQTNPQCSNGSCSFSGCGNGTHCCANGCAICCDASECSDNIECTKDTCGANGCVHSPDNGMCAGNQFCDATFGCISCKTAADCDDGLLCTTETCSLQTHTCLYSTNCGGVGGGGYCDPSTGKCVECTYDSDCQGGVISRPDNTIIPPGAECHVQVCQKGTCVDNVTYCTGEQYCCPPYGCSIGCIQTK
jgi:hypothetical protein